MNILRDIYQKKTFSCLDFGSKKVTVFIGEKKADGSLKILGFGEAEALGLEAGQVKRLPDVVESIDKALSAASFSSQVKVETLYFNFDDLKMKGQSIQGCKFLQGEGQVQIRDRDDVCRIAQAHASSFEKSIVYAKATGYIIDERDQMQNPVGVFGKKLDVCMHVLQADSYYCQSWQKIMDRCDVPNSVMVPSAWSTVYGVVTAQDRQKRRLIADLGEDFINCVCFENNSIVGYSIFLTTTFTRGALPQAVLSILKELAERFKNSEEILLTGDLAADVSMLAYLKEHTSLPVRPAAPLGISDFNDTSLASLAGLFFVADELERRHSNPIMMGDKDLFSNIKKKAQGFIHEYF